VGIVRLECHREKPVQTSYIEDYDELNRLWKQATLLFPLFDFARRGVINARIL